MNEEQELEEIVKRLKFYKKVSTSEVKFLLQVVSKKNTQILALQLEIDRLVNLNTDKEMLDGKFSNHEKFWDIHL